MGAEAVVFGDAAPMDIDPLWSFGARADAVAPIIEIAKTTPRPADHRHMNLLERIHHILAIAADVGDFAVLADPNAFIDAAPQMFGKLAIDMPVDRRSRLGGIDRDIGH